MFYKICQIHIISNMIDLGLFIEKSLSQVFSRIKLHNKKDLEIFFFLLKKVISIWGQFCITAVVQINILHWKCLSLLRSTRKLTSKYIFLDPFFYVILSGQKLLISCLSISIMSNKNIHRWGLIKNVSSYLYWDFHQVIRRFLCLYLIIMFNCIQTQI